MRKILRLSAGAIVIRRGRMLLVRHGAAVHGSDFLVPPGGGVEGDETFRQAVVREVKEETGLVVKPTRVLFIEDMISSKKKVVKIWFLCRLTGGLLATTEGAMSDGIVECGWYSEPQVKDKVVYPSVLAQGGWKTFGQRDWETVYLENVQQDGDF
jgi:8-oxo-dGTP diphosphatase